MKRTQTVNLITEERRTNPMKKLIATAILKGKSVLANSCGDQMTGWLIVVLVVVVVGAVFMTLYQSSITQIWNSIVAKITGLLS